MTSLQITPKWKDKSARFRGTIAAGEHVAVTIANDDGAGNPFITSTENLRLRVVGPDGRTLAVFPEPVPEGETPEAWDTDTTPLSCTLNLNTVQMLRAVPPAANVPLLFVLDDFEAKTLFFKDVCEVTHWPRRVGEEEPVDLDGYQDFVEETKQELAGFESRLANAETAVSASAESASSAAGDADRAADAAEAAQAAAQAAQAAAEGAASDIPAISAKVDTLVGSDTGKSARTIAREEASAAGSKFIPVTELPSAATADKKAIYLVPRTTSKTGNIYDEYIVVEPTTGTYAWEEIGSTEIDLSGYVKSVASQTPDANGNVTLTPASIGAASTADATLTDRFSAWSMSPATMPGGDAYPQPELIDLGDGDWQWKIQTTAGEVAEDEEPGSKAAKEAKTSIAFQWAEVVTATRTALSGYQLGPDDGLNPNMPLASEAEAEALRTAVAGKQDALTAQQLANIAAVPGKADDPAVVHKSGAETITGNKTFSGSLNVSDSHGNLLIMSKGFLWTTTGDVEPEILFPTTSGTLALTDDLRYALTTKTIDNGAVTLDDRAINAVAVSSSLASLTLNFPTATSGKARDFGLRLTVASGITTAPELALPQGVVCENADGEAPEIGADGAATILYFTETASGVFLVKGEVVTAIS